MQVKKLLVSLAVLGVLLVGFNVGSDHYRIEFHSWAISHEMGKGNLSLNTVQVGDILANYYSSPQKDDTVVMLHGFGGNKNNWLRLAQQLNQNYQVIAPDLKGHGANVRDVNDSYHISDQVDFVHSFLGKLGVTKFHLAGNSMGGAIASLYAARYPGQVKSLILISPAGVHDVPSDLDLMLEEGKNPLIATNEEEFAKLMDFVMVEKPFIPAAIAKVEAETAVSRVDINRKIFTDIRADLELDLNKEFNSISAPTLIIWGDQDQAINVANIDKYADLIPNAEKAVIKGIGHVSMIEVPEYTAELMRPYLKR